MKSFFSRSYSDGLESSSISCCAQFFTKLHTQQVSLIDIFQFNQNLYIVNYKVIYYILSNWQSFFRVVIRKTFQEVKKVGTPPGFKGLGLVLYRSVYSVSHQPSRLFSTNFWFFIIRSFFYIVKFKVILYIRSFWLWFFWSCD